MPGQKCLLLCKLNLVLDPVGARSASGISKLWSPETQSSTLSVFVFWFCFLFFVLEIILFVFVLSAAVSMLQWQSCYNRDCTACNLAFYRKYLPTSALQLSPWPTPEVACRVSYMPSVLCLSASGYSLAADMHQTQCATGKVPGDRCPRATPTLGRMRACTGRSQLPSLLLRHLRMFYVVSSGVPSGMEPQLPTAVMAG